MEQKDLQVFNFNQAKVTVITDEHGEPWWIAKEVCGILEIGNPGQACAKLDDDEKNSIILNDGIPTRGNPTRIIVNEPGLYTLILRSDKPQAKEFRRWITHEVLQTIRKTGGYIQGAAEMNDLEIMTRAFDVRGKMIEDRDKRLAELAPKAEVYDEAIVCGISSTMTSNTKGHSMLTGAPNKNGRPYGRPASWTPYLGITGAICSSNRDLLSNSGISSAQRKLPG